MDRLTIDEFIERANIVHNNKYNYDKAIYINRRTKLIITCKIHGDFEQNAWSHLSGYGCKICGLKKGVLGYTTNEFIEKAIHIHGNKYDYSESNYTGNHNKLKIICPIHGVFEQTPNSHLVGSGCNKCGIESARNKRQYKYNNWSYSEWREAGEASKNFDSFKVYIIECWNEVERFVKIGKTFTTIGNRFRGGSCSMMPYEYRVIKEIKGSALDISKIEHHLQNKFKKYSYSPRIEFSGHTECFDINIKNKALSIDLLNL